MIKGILKAVSLVHNDSMTSVSPHEFSDAECVSRCLSGEHDHFGSLYERYIDKIYAFIYYRTSSKETAEDIVSTVFIKALEKLDTFDENKASFSTWLYRIARNTLIDHYRTHKQETDISLVEHVAGETSNLSETVEARNKLKEIETYLKTLTEKQQEIVILRVWNELSFKEIAEITGRSEESCKMLFSRTIKKVRLEFPAALAFLFSFIDVIK
jgi:RNA polymerase sigma-70 factor (ECF subfamily)